MEIEMQRPNFTINEKQAKEIAEKLYSGFKSNFDNARIDIKSLAELALDSDGEDGYELAKKLEDITSCHIDTLIVEELDVLSDYISDEKKSMLKRWVKENNILPMFAIGDNVSSKHGRKQIEGKIKDIFPLTAQYLIDVGEDACPVVKYEDTKGVKDEPCYKNTY